MLTMLLALYFIVSEPVGKNVASHHVSFPDILGIYKRKGPPSLPYTLKPQWQVALLTSRDGITLIQSAESNLEHWRNLMQPVNIEEWTPKQACLKPKEYRFGIGMYYWPTTPPTSHYPWHPAIRRYLPWLGEIGQMLHHELVAMPSIQRPYYEGVVCSMPTIKCKGKTQELLEEQLLERYAQYLSALHEATDLGSQVDNRGLNGALIAQSADKTTPSIPKLILRTELESDTERLVRRQRSYMDRHGRDMNYQLTGLEDLPGTNRLKDR